MDVPQLQAGPVPPAPLGNPIISLVAALLRASIYVLQILRQLVAFVTLTIPSLMVRILGWSWTLQLNFPGLLFISLLVPTGLFFLVRYRYLNKYTALKEVPLAKPDKKSLHPDVLSDNSSAPLHNYLDEFLSAIRIFGFLEKPVFHELSRHLQTRRLIAGDSLTLDANDKSFYCVVDGHVQVFAPSPLLQPSSSQPFSSSNSDDDEPPLNGYDLLTEVSSGGTLSSLFTILSLFTEDVRLSWDPSDTNSNNNSNFDHPPSSTRSNSSTNLNNARPRRSERANSDVSAFDLMNQPIRDGERDGESSYGGGSTVGGGESVGTATPMFNGNGGGFNGGGGGFEEERDPRGGFGSRSSSYGAQGGGGYRSEPDRGAKFTGGGGGGEERGTVARATVDTTLAVIPADAFRRLTRKFPKASAHIVQVILTRFSRVTFTTAHQYLGLTAEVLRAESSLNSLVSHPLPSEFYEGGGMDALRQKFRPDTRTTVDSDGSSDEGEGNEGTGDYFNLGRSYGDLQGGQKRGSSSNSIASSGQKTPGPRGAGSAILNMEPVKPSPKSFHQPIPSISHLHSPSQQHQQPIVRGGSFSESSPTSSLLSNSTVTSPSSSSVASPASFATSLPPSVVSPLPPTPQSQPIFRRTSTRRQVQAGDLLSMTNDFDATNFRPTAFSAQTPRPIKWDNASRSRVSSVKSRHEPKPPKINLASSAASIPDFNLRDAVMSSLAKSIGLIQPPPPPPSFPSSTSPSMYSPSASTSLTGSPSPFGNGNGNGNGGRFNSSFGSLSMLERSGPGAADDETSSIMTGMSSAWGAAGGTGQEELENEVEILYFPKGGELVKEGEKNAGLFFVIDGFLDVSIPPPGKPGQPKNSNATSATSEPKRPDPLLAARKSSKNNSHLPPISASRPRHGSIHTSKATDFVPPPVVPGSTHLYTVKPGGIAGYLSALSNSASYVDIKAKTDVYVGFLPAEALERLLERRPIVLLTLAKRLISLLSPLVLHIDASLDWMQLNAGQVLYRQGDPSDSIYIVINGRLRALAETEGEGAVETVAEFGQGESLGELDVITTVPRSNTVHAIRDTELARMPLTLFNAISTRHPATTLKFLRLIASRVTKEVDSRSHRSAPPPGALELTPSNLNLKTICILPSSRNVPVAVFANKLRAALEDIGAPTAYLDQTTMSRHLGRHTFSTMGKLKVAGWLAEQEQRYRIVLYVADTAASSQWTVTCIRQADCILVVGMGDDPSLGEYEKLLLEKKTTARKELVLLHPERSVPPGSTRPWLKERPWISQHHHVELPGIVFPPKSTPVEHDPAAIVAFKHLREKVQTQIKRFRGLRPLGRARTSPHLSDFARLARRLCGASIGVVLGGGGGRGISHIGFLQAMENEGIPIDIVGGCSIGAFVGGLYAKDGNLLATTGRAKQFSGRMASVWRILSDLTFPTISYTTGHEFNRGIYKAFNDVHLEDLWLPYFCNSTSLRWSRMEIHTTGYAWRAIRASMTLAGLLPPLSENGNMLVDGGYIDNLPVSTMTAMGASRIFAIDVGGADDTSPRNYGDSVSGFWVLLNRYNPFSDASTIPTLTEVTSRLTYVSSIKSLMEAKATPGVLYQAMPVQQFTTMGGFSQFNEIYDIGLQAATKQLSDWKDEGKLPTGLLDGYKTVGGGRSKNSVRLRRNSV